MNFLQFMSSYSWQVFNIRVATSRDQSPWV
jgi:hypothetical protein